MATLFLVNVPHDFAESDLNDWVTSRGVVVESVRLIRDLVTGASPSFAYVDISDDIEIATAIKRLNRQVVGNRTILASEACRDRPSSANAAAKTA